MLKKNPSLTEVDALVMDFDGVLTDNKVIIDDLGRESVICSRSDGLAFSALKKLTLKMFIISTEKNPVVEMRGRKIGVKVYQGISDKLVFLKKVAENENLRLDRIMYVGNDLNDFAVMNECGISVCPSDSHPKIKKIANLILRTNGGQGVIREIVEDIFNINIERVLYGIES